MENTELQDIWKSYDQKLERVLAINKNIAINLTRLKLNDQISRLYRPKWGAILIGLPYTILLIAITVIAYFAQAYFVAIGFGCISLIMTILIISYFYHLYLVNKVKNNEDILSTQQQLAKLRISSYNSVKLAIFQLPFWSICWVSVEALKDDIILYGGVNLLVFLLLTFFSFWIYKELSHEKKESKVRDFFISGNEWEPIVKSTELLEQIKEYNK